MKNIKVIKLWINNKKVYNIFHLNFTKVDKSNNNKLGENYEERN